MANISLYELDGTIDPNDKVIGTDGTTGADQGKTKNYTIAQLGAYINALGVESVTTTDGAFIELTPNSPTIGQVVITADLSATGTPTATTGLRGDNTWGELGLEAINESGQNFYLSTDETVGYRLIGSDPANHGDIGERSIDLSKGLDTSYIASTSEMASGADLTAETRFGPTAAGTLVTGRNNVSRAVSSAIIGESNIMNGGPNSEPVYFVGGLIQGQANESYGLNYYNFQSGLRNLIGDKTLTAFSNNGFSPSTPIIYHGAQIGMKNELQGGYASIQLGYGLLGSGPFCTTVGCANVDETLTPAVANTSGRNNLNPRFIVGTGDWAGPGSLPTIGTRRNGFVVMSDGTAKFPELTNAKIDAAGDDSAVTKGWVNANAAAGTIDGSGTANYLPVWQDADTLTDSFIQATYSASAGLLTLGVNADIDIGIDDVIGDEAYRFAINGTTQFAIRETGISTPKTISAQEYIKVGQSTDVATGSNVGAIRYRSDANNSYAEMVMQTGASTYAWVIIQQNSW
jgi:hypothetical protein